MKISARIQAIANMVNAEKYQHIWDCCCDHGLLGMLLLERNTAPNIHFVDQVPSIMTTLEKRLQQYFPRHNAHVNAPLLHANEIIHDDSVQFSSSNSVDWWVHCQDVNQLPLASCQSTARHLVIIAGVGGELLVSLVEQILASNPTRNIEFILCPVHHTYFVRQSLSRLGLGLIDERLLQDNRRFYEVLHVSSRASIPVSCTGDKLWRADPVVSRGYLQKLLTHYQQLHSASINAAEQTSSLSTQLAQILTAYRWQLQQLTEQQTSAVSD